MNLTSMSDLSSTAQCDQIHSNNYVTLKMQLSANFVQQLPSSWGIPKNLTRTNTLASFDFASVTRKRVLYNIDARTSEVAATHS